MRKGIEPLEHGTHVDLVYRGLNVVGIVLDFHEVKHKTELYYNIVVPISKTKCSVVVRTINSLKVHDFMEEYNGIQEKPIKKHKKFFIKKNR